MLQPVEIESEIVGVTVEAVGDSVVEVMVNSKEDVASDSRDEGVLDGLEVVKASVAVLDLVAMSVIV